MYLSKLQNIKLKKTKEMAKEKKSPEPSGLITVNDSIQKTTDFKGLTEQLKRLSKKPKQGKVKTNKLADNSAYLEIAYYEQQLDYIYNGLWSVKNWTHEIVLNEVVGSLELWVFHSEAKGWIVRTGVAAWPIMVDALTKDQREKMTKQQRNEYALNPSNKKPNALVTGYPRLKAECIKNAAKSLGQIFGRNLNRNHEDELEGLQTQQETMQQIAECKTVEELSLVKESLPDIMLNDTQILDLLTARYHEIKHSDKEINQTKK